MKEHLDAAVESASPSRSENGDLETREFSFSLGRSSWVVRHEKLLNIDFHDKKAFENSNFHKELKNKLTKWEAVTARPSAEALQLTLAEHYLTMGPNARDKKSGKFKSPKVQMQECYEKLWRMPRGEEAWLNISNAHAQLLTTGAPKKQPLKKILEDIIDQWRYLKKHSADQVYNNMRNRYAATTPHIYRNIPEHMMYILVDRNDKLVMFNGPHGIQNAYGSQVLVILENDTEHFWALKTKPANKSSKRYLSDDYHFSINPHLKVEDCGTEHDGAWHGRGDRVGRGDVFQTSDFTNLDHEQKALLLRYLETRHSVINRMLTFWFGVFEPELMQEYQALYKAIPEHARLPPTCEQEDEVWSLKVFLQNRQTDEHCDEGDFTAGITGLSQLGKWEGGKMCFRELGLALPGYAVPGNAFIFRGSVLTHAVAPWSGRRTAFDFTTHESLRLMANRIRAEGRGSSSNSTFKEERERTDGTRTEMPVTAFRVPEKISFHTGSSNRGKRKRSEGSTTKVLGEKASFIDYIKKEVDSNGDSDNETILADDEGGQLPLS